MVRVTCALIQEAIDETTTALAAVGVTLAASAFCSPTTPRARPWNPDWVTHRVCDLAKAAGVDLDIKAIRHYTASQSLLPASTSATPPPDSGIPAGALPR